MTETAPVLTCHACKQAIRPDDVALDFGRSGSPPQRLGLCIACQAQRPKAVPPTWREYLGGMPTATEPHDAALHPPSYDPGSPYTGPDIWEE